MTAISLCLASCLRLSAGTFLGQTAGEWSETASKTVENNVLVVRHGADAAQPSQAKPLTPPVPTPQQGPAVQFGGAIIDRGATRPVATQQPPASSGQVARPAPPAPAATRPTPEEIAVLNDLADLGLIAIRRERTDDAPSWKYKPKQYYGYRAKPEWTQHDRAGWRYDALNGWRYRREPDFALRPGGVERLLRQMHTRGDNWYVTRWQ